MFPRQGTGHRTDGVDLDHIDAKFDRGVLTLRLPKTGTSQSAVRTIEVK
ncbi:Hsp20 family protein [Cupriavidus sp. UYPR2.512]|nr:Hsp20 family protein [Cupriavidus sp. UYPR2.512]